MGAQAIDAYLRWEMRDSVEPSARDDGVMVADPGAGPNGRPQISRTNQNDSRAKTSRSQAPLPLSPPRGQCSIVEGACSKNHSDGSASEVSSTSSGGGRM